MDSCERDELRQLLAEVLQLRQALVEAQKRQAADIAAVRPRHRYSATNLVHYVELRRHDIRDLQARLADHGLSSLGRTESRVLATIDALLRTLARLTGEDREPVEGLPGIPDGAELLLRNSVNLLGPHPRNRKTRIMVTLPSEAARDRELVQAMLASGMDIARINCAHDGPEAWDAMIANIRAAEAATGAHCLVSMDLAGPKLRTGPLAPGPQVLRIRPVRNQLGQVVEAARIWLGSRPEGADVQAPLVPLRQAGWAGRRRVGERIRLVDARGAARSLRVEAVHDGGCLVSVRRTTYLVPGLELAVGKNWSARGGRTARIGTLPSAPQSLLVRRGDRMVLTKDMTPAVPSGDGVHRIGCSLPEVFSDVRPGERVWFDDGKIGGLISEVSEDNLSLEVVSAGPGGTRLRGEKGINVPDTALSISALTAEDMAALDYVRRHADIVSMSFVRGPADVQNLLAHLDEAQDRALDIVLKIETVAAFEALPQILLQAMRWEDVGVMIARGDLAVEAGFERLAEVQEEILWLCEAAHVPVIWATQVLDRLARKGLPSRAEVTDAAMAERAECVMLNKGPYIAEAITMLSGILGRMQDHMQKKRSLLRRLHSWDLDHVEAP